MCKCTFYLHYLLNLYRTSMEELEVKLFAIPLVCFLRIEEVRSQQLKHTFDQMTLKISEIFVCVQLKNN